MFILIVLKSLICVIKRFFFSANLLIKLVVNSVALCVFVEKMQRKEAKKLVLMRGHGGTLSASARNVKLYGKGSEPTGVAMSDE